MQSAIEGWERELEGAHDRLGRLFKRSEPRQCSLDYLKGLLSGVERKNSWQLAEWMGEATPHGAQHLLKRAQWDVDGARDVLREYVIAHLGDREAMLIVDETGLSRRDSIRRAYNANIAARRGALKTARL